MKSLNHTKRLTNDFQKSIVRTDYLLEILYILGFLLLLFVVGDIVRKTRLSVKALRYLGSNNAMNPLEYKEYEKVNELMKIRVLNKEGGNAMTIAKYKQNREDIEIRLNKMKAARLAKQ